MSADFLDSNVFVYLFDETNERKRATAERIVGEALAGGTTVISLQVVQETVNDLTRKLGASSYDARRFLDHVLAPSWGIGPSPELYASALDLREGRRLGLYDALIVGAAIGAGCDRLLSEDLQYGQRIGRLQVVDPFTGA